MTSAIRTMGYVPILTEGITVAARMDFWGME